MQWVAKGFNMRCNICSKIGNSCKGRITQVLIIINQLRKSFLKNKIFRFFPLLTIFLGIMLVMGLVASPWCFCESRSVSPTHDKFDASPTRVSPTHTKLTRESGTREFLILWVRLVSQNKKIRFQSLFFYFPCNLCRWSRISY